MMTAEQNYQLLLSIEANRRFLLQAYQQNPKLLERAEARIKEIFDMSPHGEIPGKPMLATPTANAQRGASLIELIMFIVIVSVALAGILLVMNQTTKGSADPLIRKQAMAAASSLLEEIELQTFTPDPGATCAAVLPGCNIVTQPNRSTLTHTVSDYNGFATTGIYPISGVAATAGLANYNASVAVVGAALGTIPAASAVQINVTVTTPTGEASTATGYRAAY
jgi:MSHA pilin protein MshD